MVVVSLGDTDMTTDAIITAAATFCAAEALRSGASPRALDSQEDADRGDYDYLNERLGREADRAEMRAFRTAYSAALAAAATV